MKYEDKDKQVLRLYIDLHLIFLNYDLNEILKVSVSSAKKSTFYMDCNCFLLINEILIFGWLLSSNHFVASERCNLDF